MQASDRILAHRYAKALFQAGLERKEEARVQQDLADTLKLLREQLGKFRNPLLGAAKQKTLLKSLVGTKVSATTLRFLELLVDKKRFSLLPWITMEFGAMLDAQRGLVRAQVRSAAKLGDKELDRLKSDLKRFTGKDVAVEVKEAPELLGGMVVKMGDWVLDGSLQGQLRRLAAQLVEES